MLMPDALAVLLSLCPLQDATPIITHSVITLMQPSCRLESNDPALVLSSGHIDRTLTAFHDSWFFLLSKDGIASNWSVTPSVAPFGKSLFRQK